MWERNSRLTGKKRNVSETTLSSSYGSGDNISADFEDICEINFKNRRMEQTSASSSESDGEEFHIEARKRNPKKPKCFTKNAILARRNRIKKKKYLEDLETEVKSLRAENSALRITVEGYSKDMEVVRKENRYLRNVLASRREISRLLGVIQDKTGLLTSSSTCKYEADPRRNQAVVKPQPKASDKVVNSISNTSSVKRSLQTLLPMDDPELFPQGESVDSPITHSDVPLSGFLDSDEASIPSNLFSSDDHDYVNFDSDIPDDWLAGEEELPNIGICLHVAKQRVSLEFCQYCNESASCI